MLLAERQYYITCWPPTTCHCTVQLDSLGSWYDSHILAKEGDMNVWQHEWTSCQWWDSPWTVTQTFDDPDPKESTKGSTLEGWLPQNLPQYNVEAFVRHHSSQDEEGHGAIHELSQKRFRRDIRGAKLQLQAEALCQGHALSSLLLCMCLNPQNQVIDKTGYKYINYKIDTSSTWMTSSCTSRASKTLTRWSLPPGSTAMTLECYSVSTTVAKCERTVSTDEVSLPDGNIADIKDSYI